MIDHRSALMARIGGYAAVMPGVFVRLWRLLIGPAVYRPAAHYMRGPGPKCREKSCGPDGATRDPGMSN